MNEIILNELELKTFTEQDTEDYCLLNNINHDNIIELYLGFNKLTDISGIKLFKNLEKLTLVENQLTNISVLNNLTKLYIHNNKIKDISVLKNIINYLICLRLDFNDISDISVLKYLTDLQILYLGNNKITDISVLKKLFKLKILNIKNLKLESDQIDCIKNLENLKTLFCKNGFKDMTILNKLNKNIEIIF